MLVMAAGYILINATVQNVIQPRLVVVRLNLTPFTNLFSSTFWPLVLGPVGAIIGVPLTMAVHSLLLDVDPYDPVAGRPDGHQDSEGGASGERRSLIYRRIVAARLVGRTGCAVWKPHLRRCAHVG